MRRRWLLFAVILTAPYGCDNVTWGGVDVRLQAPPAKTEVTPEVVPEAEQSQSLPELPAGPILLAGTREGNSATLVAVGEVRGDGLAPFPSETEAPGFLDHFSKTLLPPGAELVLFSEGSRIGRLTVTETSTDTRFCVPRPSVTGVLEVTPGASNARRILALLDTGAVRRPYAPYRSWDHDYDQRVASLSLASDAITAVGATWPPSLLESRADIQAFRLPEASGGSVAATFLFDDRLAVAPSANDAYAIFVMGSRGGSGYQSDFVWYRKAQDEGKGAPRYFSHLDWNRDGRSEILLDVFGAEHRWYAALAQRNGTWVRTFQDPCGEPRG
jgi:hypothetical protein